MDKKNINIDLIAKYLAGELNNSQISDVKRILANDEALEQDTEKVKMAWEKWKRNSTEDIYDADSAFKNITSKLNSDEIINEDRWQINQTLLKIAAVIVVIIGVGIVFFKSNIFNSSIGAYQIVETTEQNKTVVLPDNSQVYLNYHSSVKYAKNFNEKADRVIEFTGEGYFDVFKNPDKPFIIKAGNSVTKVLGTSFNIKAYPDESTIQITVNSGKVSFSDEANSRKEILVKGEKAILSKSKDSLNIQITKIKNSDLNYLSWQTKNLTFNNANLSYVLDKLEEVYHVPIEITNPEIKDLKLTASFAKEDLPTIFDVIEVTFNIQIENNNNKWVVH